ncbi:hypothetical protein [Janibacter sp. GS2]|uniref:hypothetical protein n=1 Tax=Janibacter sp. GS2 TaxID=3442646 RepID=UPI003EB8BF21
MTTQELPVTHEETDTTSRRRILLTVLIAVLAIGLIAGLTLWWPGRDGNGDYWTEIDARQPITVDQQAMVERLEGSGGEWSAELVQGEHLEKVDWSKETAIDVAELSRGRTVISNLTSEESVRRNGRLLILGPAYRPLVERILQEDPVVFVDEDSEEGRLTYRLGGWLAYYSPEGAQEDRTDDVETYLEEVVRCPYDADPCPSGGS